LRYINQIPLSEEMTDLSLLISVAPPLTGRLQRPLLGFYQRYELSNEGLAEKVPKAKRIGRFSGVKSC
jgi:hypothetical protein